MSYILDFAVSFEKPCVSFISLCIPDEKLLQQKSSMKKKTIYSIKTSSYHKIIKILDTSASYYSLA